MEADRSPGSSRLTGAGRVPFLIDRQGHWSPWKSPGSQIELQGGRSKPGAWVFCLPLQQSLCRLPTCLSGHQPNVPCQVWSCHPPTCQAHLHVKWIFVSSWEEIPMIFMHCTECQTLALSTQLNKPLKSRKEKDKDMKGRQGFVNDPHPLIPSTRVWEQQALDQESGNLETSSDSASTSGIILEKSYHCEYPISFSIKWDKQQLRSHKFAKRPKREPCTVVEVLSPMTAFASDSKDDAGR